jgi:hypothetical protein
VLVEVAERVRSRDEVTEVPVLDDGCPVEMAEARGMDGVANFEDGHELQASTLNESSLLGRALLKVGKVRGIARARRVSHVVTVLSCRPGPGQYPLRRGHLFSPED